MTRKGYREGWQGSGNKISGNTARHKQNACCQIKWKQRGEKRGRGGGRKKRGERRPVDGMKKGNSMKN